MRRLLLLLLLGSCDRPVREPSYQVSCEQVVCDEPDIHDVADTYERCAWCVTSVSARVVTFRVNDGCWGVEREFDWNEPGCVEFNRF